MKHYKLMVVVTAMVCGCQEAAPEAFFEAEEHPRAAEQIMEAQAARGARADGNLFAAHFDGDAVNALGRSKLDLMVADNGAAFPVDVYVAGGAGADVAARHNSVRSYLVDAGLTPSQFRTLEGPNPKTVHGAAEQLRNLPKTDSSPAEPVEASPLGAMMEALSGGAK